MEGAEAENMWGIETTPLQMNSAVHDALLIFFGTMMVWNAAALAGSTSKAIAPSIGALATAGLVLGAWLSNGQESAGATLGAGLVGITCAWAFSRWLATWAQR